MKLITATMLDLYEKLYEGTELPKAGDKVPFLHKYDVINDLMQDIQLINSLHASDGYTRALLVRIKELCDESSSERLSLRIHCYAGFQEIAGELEKIEQYITLQTDVVWAGSSSPEEFLEELREDTCSIRYCSYTALEKVRTAFLPTSVYQELALANGWGEQYMLIADRFDHLYAKVRDHSFGQST